MPLAIDCSGPLDPADDLLMVTVLAIDDRFIFASSFSVALTGLPRTFLVPMLTPDDDDAPRSCRPFAYTLEVGASTELCEVTEADLGLVVAAVAGRRAAVEGALCFRSS